MRIGELARRTGTTPKALRLYEARGLLGTVARAGSYRQYGEQDVVQVQLIRQAQALGFRLSQLDGLNALRDDKGMTVIQIAHTDIKRFDSPEHDPYDRYVIKLHARAAALLQEHSDIVLFANYRISTVKADVGFNKKVARAVGSGERVLHTSERPAFLAKNRYGLPDTLPRTMAYATMRLTVLVCFTINSSFCSKV